MNRYFKDYSEFLSGFFDGKIQKISIDTSLGCPNRDGTLGTGGCIYCNNEAFSPDLLKRKVSVREQVERGKLFFSKKYPTMRFLAYFQSYTSTYGNNDTLLRQFSEALDCKDVVGLVIGTRPDCMPDDLLSKLKRLREETDSEIFIEFGAESSHNETLKAINRWHTWECTVDAVRRSHAAGFPVGVHLIIGLPGENTEKAVETVRRINTLPVSTVKFHQLQVLRGTILAKRIASGEIGVETYTPCEYAAICARLVKELRKDIAIERFVAQAPPEMLVSPRWGLKNYQFTKLLEEAMETLK